MVRMLSAVGLPKIFVSVGCGYAVAGSMVDGFLGFAALSGGKCAFARSSMATSVVVKIEWQEHRQSV